MSASILPEIQVLEIVSNKYRQPLINWLIRIFLDRLIPTIEVLLGMKHALLPKFQPSLPGWPANYVRMNPGRQDLKRKPS